MGAANAEPAKMDGIPRNEQCRKICTWLRGKIMRKLKKKTGFTAAAILLLLLNACGGGGGGGVGGGGGRLPIVTIYISPDTATIKAGESIPLTITISPRNTEFTVSAPGSYTSDGARVVYTPPAVAGTYTLTITAGVSGRATARITVMDISDVNVPDETISNGVGGINDNDRILVETIDPQGRRKAFLADKNGGNRIPVEPPGGGDVYVYGINNSNNVLGRSDNGYFLMRPRAGIIEYVSLELKGYSSADFTGINDAGQLVGYYTESDGYVFGFIQDGDDHVWVMYPDDYAGCNTDNSPPCGTYVTGINDNGKVVGYYITAAGVQRGFIYDGDVFTPIEHPDNRPVNPINLHVSGINDSDKVVGAFWGSDLYAHGFVADGVTFTVIDHPGATNSGAGSFLTGINNSNVLTGWFDDGFKRGFLMAKP